MEEIVKSLAFVAGTAAIIIPGVTAAFNVGRLLRADGDHLVLRVGKEKFVIDVGSIDRTDIGMIDSATRAVEEKAKVTA